MGTLYRSSISRDIQQKACCSSHSALLFLLQRLTTASSTVKMSPASALPHGKYLSKSKEAISAEDLSLEPNTSCPPATADKAAVLLLLWEPLNGKKLEMPSLFTETWNAIQIGTPTRWITISQS